MRWPWRRSKSNDGLAQEALAESARKLEVAKAQAPRVDRVVSKLEQLRRQNRFGAMMAAAFKEHR